MKELRTWASPGLSAVHVMTGIPMELANLIRYWPAAMFTPVKSFLVRKISVLARPFFMIVSIMPIWISFGLKFCRLSGSARMFESKYEQMGSIFGPVPTVSLILFFALVVYSFCKNVCFFMASATLTSGLCRHARCATPTVLVRTIQTNHFMMTCSGCMTTHHILHALAREYTAVNATRPDAFETRRRNATWLQRCYHPRNNPLRHNC